MARSRTKAASATPLFIISGGDGTSGSQLVHTALAQFPDAQLDLRVIGNVRTLARLRRALDRVQRANGSIVHTLVDEDLRRELVLRARHLNVPQIDAMGRVMQRLAALLGRDPLGQPGRYRQLRAAYFDRVAAIEFAVRHDDGQSPDDLDEADIVLVGVSRTGKTPLAMYLSVQGWKVANVPFITGIPLPPPLDRVDPERVVGLTIDPVRLRQFRGARSRKLQLDAEAGYADLRAIREEVDASVRLCRHRGYALCEVTDRPIEETAEEVLATVASRLRALGGRSAGT